MPTRFIPCYRKVNSKLQPVSYTRVDESLYPILSSYRWYLNPKGYPIRSIKLPTGKHTMIYLHWDVYRLTYPDPTQPSHGSPAKHLGKYIDHIDRNRLNNQAINLRMLTHSQNLINRRLNRNNTSGYIGVSWHKAANSWIAGIEVNNKRIHLGYFNTPEEASKAYLAAREIYFPRIVIV